MSYWETSNDFTELLSWYTKNLGGLICRKLRIFIQISVFDCCYVETISLFYIIYFVTSVAWLFWSSLKQKTIKFCLEMLLYHDLTKKLLNEPVNLISFKVWDSITCRATTDPIAKWQSIWRKRIININIVECCPSSELYCCMCKKTKILLENVLKYPDMEHHNWFW